MADPRQNCPLLSPDTPRLLPPRLHTRTPSRSPTRTYLSVNDDILADLSPARTLEAFTTPTGRLKSSIESATQSERAFGIRAALASKNIQEWVDELEDWSWPAEGGSLGFEVPLAKRRKVSNEDYISRNGIGDTEPEYIGSLLAPTVLEYETRIDEIHTEMDDLHVEEIKRQVLDTHFSPRSRPSSSGSNAPPSMLSSYTRMDDFTAIVTATVLKALPKLSRLTRLMDVWSIRLNVLRKVPRLLRQLEEAEVALRSGWNAIRTPEPPRNAANNDDMAISRETFGIMKNFLQEKVTRLGQDLDYMLDTLEGREDTLPDAWLDRMEAIETDYGEWSVTGDRKVREAEWARIAKAQKENEDELRRQQEEAARSKAQKEAEELEARRKEEEIQMREAEIARLQAEKLAQDLEAQQRKVEEERKWQQAEAELAEKAARLLEEQRIAEQTALLEAQREAEALTLRRREEEATQELLLKEAERLELKRRQDEVARLKREEEIEAARLQSEEEARLAEIARLSSEREAHKLETARLKAEQDTIDAEVAKRQAEEAEAAHLEAQLQAETARLEAQRAADEGEALRAAEEQAAADAERHQRAEEHRLAELETVRLQSENDAAVAEKALSDARGAEVARLKAEQDSAAEAERKRKAEEERVEELHLAERKAEDEAELARQQALIDARRLQVEQDAAAEAERLRMAEEERQAALVFAKNQAEATELERQESLATVEAARVKSERDEAEVKQARLAEETRNSDLAVARERANEVAEVARRSTSAEAAQVKALQDAAIETESIGSAERRRQYFDTILAPNNEEESTLDNSATSFAQEGFDADWQTERVAEPQLTRDHHIEAGEISTQSTSDQLSTIVQVPVSRAAHPSQLRETATDLEAEHLSSEAPQDYYSQTSHSAVQELSSPQLHQSRPESPAHHEMEVRNYPQPQLASQRGFPSFDINTDMERIKLDQSPHFPCYHSDHSTPDVEFKLPAFDGIAEWTPEPAEAMAAPTSPTPEYENSPQTNVNTSEQFKALGSHDEHNLTTIEGVPPAPQLTHAVSSHRTLEIDSPIDGTPEIVSNNSVNNHESLPRGQSFDAVGSPFTLPVDSSQFGMLSSDKSVLLSPVYEHSTAWRAEQSSDMEIIRDEANDEEIETPDGNKFPLATSYSLSQPTPEVLDAEPAEYFKPAISPIKSARSSTVYSEPTTPRSPMNFSDMMTIGRDSTMKFSSPRPSIPIAKSNQSTSIDQRQLIGSGSQDQDIPEVESGDGAVESIPRHIDVELEIVTPVRAQTASITRSSTPPKRISIPRRESISSSSSTVIHIQDSLVRPSTPDTGHGDDSFREPDDPSPSLRRHRSGTSHSYSSPDSPPPIPHTLNRNTVTYPRSLSFSSNSPTETSASSPDTPFFSNVDVSAAPLTSPKKNNTDDQMQQQISSLLESIPARIRLTSEPDSERTERLVVKKTRSSLGPGLRSSSSMSNYSRAPTPSFTLAPAYGKGPSRQRPQSSNPEIKLYHLSRSTGEAPIKLFVRLVGEHGERVMVRVGGGWADLGEYLKEYASHHGRRTAAINDNKVEVQDMTPRIVSSSSTTSTATIRANGRSSPISRPGSAFDRPASSLHIRKTRKSTGTRDLDIPSLPHSFRSPSTPLSTPLNRNHTKQLDTPPSVASSSASSTSHDRSSSRLSWTEEDSSLGLAGPKSKKTPISERDQVWVDSMKEKVRQASAEKERGKQRGTSFGEMDRVGGTKRLFRKT